jgi:hypothetical protein
MNPLELRDTIVQKHAMRVADLVNGAAFAFVTEQLRHIEEAGLDPADYEVAFVRDEYPRHTEDGLLITQSLRLIKVGGDE